MKRAFFFIQLVFVSSISMAQSARDSIVIVGSSTVFPFSKVVSERFGRKTAYRSPKVEPTGTGGGIKEFCRGIGVSTPDIVNASRRMKASEYALCRANGVKDIIEVHFGYDGIVIANSAKNTTTSLSLKELFLALAAKVPSENEPQTLIDNPYQKWSDINPDLPSQAIAVYGPPPTSGTRDAFTELAMEGGCARFEWIQALKASNKSKYLEICRRIREDGAYINAGENDNLIVRKLNDDMSAFGVFGFSFLDQNADKVRAIKIDGESPSVASITEGKYRVSRSLFFYIKRAHVEVVPGLRAFLEEFVSDAATGKEGYLTEKGLIPLNTDERSKLKESLAELRGSPIPIHKKAQRLDTDADRHKTVR